VGRYLGIRDGDRLVAMAGERIRVPGFTEISAVCTDPAYRGRGLAGRLMRAVAAGIRERGDTPFLASVASNTTALRLYAELGFTYRAEVTFAVLRTPA
jgi:predicted GNAT family acetyltransferase